MKQEKVQKFVFPVLLGVVIIALLQSGLIHKLFHIKVLQLPLPSSIAQAIAENIQKIIPNAIVTILPAISGLLLGALIGYSIALFVTAYPNLGYGSLFLMTIITSVPIVALAPLMNRWFPNPFFAKLAVVIVASSGAMAVNAFHGLSDLPKNVLDLMYANAASKRETFIKLRIPNSLPYVFTAFKIGITAAMLATIISEFFSTQTSGLGYMIKYTLKVGNQKQIGWAYIVSASIVSILFYSIICFFERRLLKWHISQKKK
ncbi:MAG: ABC transporter permease subunit [Clostridiales bacterium]|nr:ABC transporter permease subunit [Clostridiales bacterium]